METQLHQRRVAVTVFKVSGDLDGSTSPAFIEQAMAVIAGGTHHLLFDLSQTAYVSSAGLRGIEMVTQALAQKNGSAAQGGLYGSTFKSPYLKLLNPSPRTRKALNLAGFDMTLDIFEDLESALSAF
jgi:anti-anti-sigma factor